MILEINNYYKKIKKDIILEDINIVMESGKIYGLQGKNGSGKTMIMRAVCGLIHATKGSVKIDNKIIGKDISFPPSVGAIIENPGFVDNFSGLLNLISLATIKKSVSEDEIKSEMRRIGLDPDEKKSYKKYSLGMKQKLGIVSAYMEKPDLIILDEPTNALDESSIEVLREILDQEKKRGALIIISCHDSEELRKLTDEIFVIEHGKIKEHRSANEY